MNDMPRRDPMNPLRTCLRRALTAVGVGAAGLAVLASGAAPARADTFVDGRQLGLHVPRIADGAGPAGSYGSVRLWDAGVAWSQVERSRGRYDWTTLDRAVAIANRQNVEILYVLGATPTWAASNRRQGFYPSAGAASMPRRLSDWRRWVTAVVTRHGNSIDAYQIWNEANLRTFWQGSPAQMAQLTLAAYTIIKRLDPTATVVAASSTMRLTSAFNRFYPSYLAQLQKRRWPVDAFAVHTYGPSTAAPAIRAKYVKKARTLLRKAHAPRRPLWDTEINYGLAGPGTRYPHRDIDGTAAAVYVAQTFLDSLRLNIARTYWYSWTPPNRLLGVTMDAGTPAAVALATVHDWLIGRTAYCRNTHLRSCLLAGPAGLSEVAWTSTGSAATYTVPAFATTQCDAMARCRPVTPGTEVQIGRMPMRFGA